MTAPLVVPTTDLVAVAWLRGVPGVPSTAVATTLPSNTSTWAASGFVQVTTTGGTPNPHLPVRRPVVGVDCCAVAPGSARPPWGRANSLAEAIRAGTFGAAGRVVALSVGGLHARVLEAYLLSEPRRVTDDEGSYARYSFDLSLAWTAAAGVTLWALVGARSGEVLAYGGRALVHPDRAELEFLFPASRIVACPADLLAGSLPLTAHPDVAAVRWPLDRRDFR